jgi:hypothetical protein
MYKKITNNKIKLLGLLVFILALFFIFIWATSTSNKKPEEKVVEIIPVKTALYTGKIYHIFFHSLIVYPELAFRRDGQSNGLRDYMVTQSEFVKILNKLYENNFVLIDSHLLFSTSTNDTIVKRDLYIPEGKKPLILSLDDINYLRNEFGRGLANKLVFDSNGNVATEIITPDKKTIVTRDGDSIPIIDDFVKAHPDFSFSGAKGIIGVTGFDGVLGYRTNVAQYPTRDADIIKVKELAKKLKETGWVFASHSYSHQEPFKDDVISLNGLKYDTEKWDAGVRPLVGDTDIFIGPFGQVFPANSEKRNYLVSKGFKLIFGVGMDLYIEYFPNYIMQNRADIDGIRLIKTPWHLKEYFDVDYVLSK